MQRAWESVTKTASAKSTPAGDAKKHTVSKGEPALANSDDQSVNADKQPVLEPIQNTPKGSPDRQGAKSGAKKDVPKSAVVQAKAETPTTDKEGLTSIKLPELAILPMPVFPASAVTVRTDAVPAKAVTREPGLGKPETMLLKSMYIRYGAAENHTMLVGRVHEWRNTIRLRYAAVEQEDAHGGSVTMEGGAEIQKLHDGQHVRVRGTLIPAEDRQHSARFQVKSLEVLD